MSNCNCETESCVACSVTSCVYHDTKGVCTAGKIKVGNSSACTSSETCCDTYKSK